MARKKQPEAEGYEVNGTAYEPSIWSLIKQFAADYASPVSSRGFTVVAQNDNLIIKCHSYESGMDEPMRRELITMAMREAIDEYIKLLKKSVKSEGGGTLDMKEDKSLRNHTFDRVSLNDRWYVICSRVFEIEALESYPED